jgi:formylglycine-generating enzyme required for sulfatase activity
MNIGIVASLLAKDCKHFDVKNTRFEGFGWSNPPSPDPGPDNPLRPWWETWIAVGCGHTLEVPINFVPDATGTTIAVPRAIVEVGVPQLPGAVKLNPKDGQKYVWIPPGTFSMGCSPADSECYEDEKPSHRVTLTKGFWQGQDLVTVDVYKRFVTETGGGMPNGLNAGWVRGQIPIVNISWDDSQAYCHWAGGRLPSEAEWEYAARAGSTAPYHGPLDEISWYGDNSGREQIDSAQIWSQDRAHYGNRLAANGNTMHDVGLKRDNGWGLFDMQGNASEWVNDWYGERYYQSSPNRDPEGTGSMQLRVVRGGSWVNGRRDVRVSRRDKYPQGYRLVYVGCGVCGKARPSNNLRCDRLVVLNGAERSS